MQIYKAFTVDDLPKLMAGEERLISTLVQLYPEDPEDVGGDVEMSEERNLLGVAAQLMDAIRDVYRENQEAFGTAGIIMISLEPLGARARVAEAQGETGVVH